MTLKKIRFVLENCDAIEIDGEHIGKFFIDNITKHFCKYDSSIEELEMCETFFIEIFSEANIKYNQLGMANKEINKFKRLLYNDITSIQFNFEENNKMYGYFLNWKDNNNESNEYSQTYISNLGNCYILVDKTKKLEDFIDFDVINDEDAMLEEKENYKKDKN